MVAPPRSLALVVVVPAYNEAATVREVARRTLAVCPRVVVVDDGSTDGTTAALDGLPVEVLRHEHNCGKAAALWSGFGRALARGAGAVVTLDADLQHRPEDVPRLVAAAMEHPGAVVVGRRCERRRDAPRLRRAANRFADFWVSWLAGQAIADSQSGLRLYPAELLRPLDLPHGLDRGFVLESEILIEAVRRGHPVVSVPVPALFPPGARPSRYRGLRDTWRITRMIGGRLLRGGFELGRFRRAFLARDRRPR
jgi:glycosyltransferase involved in cell wall biosynthesis